MEVAVVVAPIEGSATTDLGYEVEVESVTVALRDVVFTVAGEVHAENRRWPSLFVSPAYAHPGHYQGGDVTGELPGTHLVQWDAEGGQALGQATLIEGTYDAGNFTFERGAAGSPIAGHSARLTGTATRDGVTTPFAVTIDSPEDRTLVGAPFEASVGEDAGTIRFHFSATDPLEGDSLFDGVDFAAIAQDGAATIGPDDGATEDAYNAIRREFQTHDHFRFTLEAP